MLLMHHAYLGKRCVYRDMVVDAESIMNSRPLTYLPLETEEKEALTPNHLLLGSSNGVKQEAGEPMDEVRVLGNAWNQMQ